MSATAEWAERAFSLLLPIAKNLKRSLPPAIDVDDLVGAGALALVKLARDPSFEWNPVVVKFRIRGAMIDSIKGKPYREATHAPLVKDAASTAPSPEEAAIRALELSRARRGMASLPPAQRSLLECVFEQGMSVRAASKRMGLAESTARRRIEGGLRRIRKGFTCGP